MKNLIIIISTFAVLISFILLLIARANGMHPDFFAFFIITPLVYAFALSRAFMVDNKPVVQRPAIAIIAMNPLFSLRDEYRDYLADGPNMGIEVEYPTFRQWFETVYHYEMADEMPTGEPFDGTYANYLAARNAGPIFPIQQSFN